MVSTHTTEDLLPQFRGGDLDNALLGEDMEKEIVTFSLEWWCNVAVILGGCAAAINIVKNCLNRDKLGVGFYSSCSEEEGNQIIIHNNSPIPINIFGYEIFRKKGWFCKEHEISTSFDGFERNSFKIAPHSIETLDFYGQDHFSVSHKSKQKYGKLRLRLYIAGRKSPVRKTLD